MKQTITTILFGVPLVLAAQNPVIRDQFSADPTARVFNNKVYIYPSHDIDAPDGNERLKEWFCMADYHVFSSENLTDWTDHGVILSQERVPWGNPEAYSMWAPDCVEKDGKYYFYFPNAPKGEARGFAIGVAVADRPEGPFTPEAEPIKGVSGIDPCVLVDHDGTSYIYWSGMGIRGARLKPNMKELDGELQEVKFPKREGMPEMPPMKVGGQVMEGLPDGFKEGPYAFKQGGWYYLELRRWPMPCRSRHLALGISRVSSWLSMPIVAGLTTIPSPNIRGNGISFTIIMTIRQRVTNVVLSVSISFILMLTVLFVRSSRRYAEWVSQRLRHASSQIVIVPSVRMPL